MDLRIRKILSEITNYQVDSRNARSGSLFFALSGKRVNGVDFLKQAFDNQALAAIVPIGYAGDDFGARLIYVDDVLKYLKSLARNSLRGELIIGVTGSLGKTTTKEFVWQLIKDTIPAYRSPGNQNSQIGLPLSILNRDPNAKVLVLEYGISRLDDMEGLLEVLKPDIGVLTSVAGVHMEFLGTIANIAVEKQKLLCSAQKCIYPLKWAPLNCGLSQLDAFKKKSIDQHLLKTFYSKKSLSKIAFGKGGDIWLEISDGICFIKEKGKQGIRVEPLFSEEHFLEDMLVAYSVGRMLGIKQQKLVERCKGLVTPNMRYEKVEKMGMLIVKDMYNASVESNKMALKYLPDPLRRGKKIGVLGQMAELGKMSEELHYEVGKYAEGKLDCLLLLGEKTKEMEKGFKNSNKPCFYFKNKEELISKLKEMVKPDDVILIKGSRFLEMEDIYKAVFE